MSEQPITNQFKDGLSVDLDVTAMGTTSLTDAKNATFLTYNGNECVLLNDMGNTRLVYKSEIDGVLKEESVTLPEGYIPMGVKEHGGVIYFVLYNPENNKTLIGSFPSPEFKTNDSLAYTGDQNTVEQSSTETEKLHPTNDRGDCINLVSGQSVNPTLAILNYMFKGLNTAFISEFNPSTNDYKKRILRPKFINTSYQQDITDFLKAQVDFNSCIWHITVEGGSILPSKILVIDKNGTGSRALEPKDYYIISFTYPSVNGGIMYKTYTTLYIPLVEKQSCNDEDGNEIEKYLPKYSSIKCSLTPYKEFDKIYFEKLYEELTDKGNKNYSNATDLANNYYTNCDNNLIGYLCKDLFFPNVKSGSLGMDLFYETVEGVYVRSKKDKQIYYRPVLMDPTPKDAGKLETNDDILEQVEKQILSVRNDIINTFNEPVIAFNNSYEELVYGLYKTITNTVVDPLDSPEVRISKRPKGRSIDVYQIPIYLTSNLLAPIGYINVEYGYEDEKKTKKIFKKDDPTTGLGKYPTHKYGLSLDFISTLKKYIYSVNIDELVFHQPSDVKVDNIKFNYTVEKLNSNYISEPQTITINYKDKASGVYPLANEGLPEWYAYPLNINIPLKSDDSSTLTSNICFAAKTKLGIAYGKMFLIKTDTFTLPSNNVEIPSTGENVSAKSKTRANTDFSLSFDTTPTVSDAKKDTVPKGDANLNTIKTTSISIVDYDKYDNQYQITIYNPKAIADKDFKITYGWECYNKGYDIDLSYLNLDGLEFDASKEYSTYTGACLWENRELGEGSHLELLKNYRIKDNNSYVLLNDVDSNGYYIDLNSTSLYKKYFKDDELKKDFDYITEKADIYEQLNPVENGYKLFSVTQSLLKGIKHGTCHRIYYLDENKIFHKSFHLNNNFRVTGNELKTYTTSPRNQVYDIRNNNLYICKSRYNDKFLYNLFKAKLNFSQNISIKLSSEEAYNTTGFNYIYRRSYIRWGDKYYKINSCFGKNQHKDGTIIETLEKNGSSSEKDGAMNTIVSKDDAFIGGISLNDFRNGCTATYPEAIYTYQNLKEIDIYGLINIYSIVENPYLPFKVLLYIARIDTSNSPGDVFHDNNFERSIGIKLIIDSDKNNCSFNLSNPHFDLSSYETLIKGKSYDNIIKLAYMIYGTLNKIYLDLWSNVNNEYDVTAITSLSPVSGLFDPNPDWMDFRYGNGKDSSYRSCIEENELFNRVHLFRDDTEKRFLNLKRLFDKGKTYLISFYALKEDMTKSDSPYLDIRATLNEVASIADDVIEAQYCMLTSYDGNNYGYKENKFKHFIVTTNDILSDKYDNQQMMKFNYVRVSFLVRNDSLNFYLGLGPIDGCRIRIRNLVAVELEDNFEDSKCYLHAPRAKIEDTSNFLEDAKVGSTKLSNLWQDTLVLPYPFYDITETF